MGLIACLGALAGCASTSSTSVQDMGDGTYRIGIHSAASLGQDKVLTDAVRKAGEFCHARGQKLQNVPDPSGYELHFRCVGAIEPTPPAPASEPPAQPAQ